MKSYRKRTGKKQEDQDKFLGLTDKVKFYLMENSTKAYAALAVFGIVIALTVLVSLLMAQSHRNQLALQAEALRYYDVESPAPGDQPMEPLERFRKARELFSKITDEHGGSPLAGIAGYYKANAGLELGEVESAENEYRSLVEGSRTDPVLYSLASLRLASILKSRGDMQGALDVYKAMTERGLLKDEAHFRAGQLYEETGQNENALFEYMAVNKDFPGSPWLPEASVKVDELSPNDEAAEMPESGAPAEAPGQE